MTRPRSFARPARQQICIKRRTFNQSTLRVKLRVVLLGVERSLAAWFCLYLCGCAWLSCG